MRIVDESLNLDTQPFPTLVVEEVAELPSIESCVGQIKLSHINPVDRSRAAHMPEVEGKRRAGFSCDIDLRAGCLRKRADQDDGEDATQQTFRPISCAQAGPLALHSHILVERPTSPNASIPRTFTGPPPRRSPLTLPDHGLSRLVHELLRGIVKRAPAPALRRMDVEQLRAHPGPRGRRQIHLIGNRPGMVGQL